MCDPLNPFGKVIFFLIALKLSLYLNKKSNPFDEPVGSSFNNPFSFPNLTNNSISSIVILFFLNPLYISAFNSSYLLFGVFDKSLDFFPSSLLSNEFCNLGEILVNCLIILLEFLCDIFIVLGSYYIRFFW